MYYPCLMRVHDWGISPRTYSEENNVIQVIASERPWRHETSDAISPRAKSDLSMNM